MADQHSGCFVDSYRLTHLSRNIRVPEILILDILAVIC